MVRSVSLMVIGLLIMNGRTMDPEATGISYALWNTLMFIGVILVWNVYPNNRWPVKYNFDYFKMVRLYHSRCVIDILQKKCRR